MRKIFYRMAILPVLALMVLSTALITVPVFADTGLHVKGAQLIASVSPGKTFQHKMIITSPDDNPPMDMLVEVRGFGQHLDGTYDALESPQDNSPHSCRSFIAAIDTPSFNLAPGDSQMVTATIKVPDNLTEGSRYAIIYIYSKPVEGKAVNYVLAADVPVCLTVGKDEAFDKTGEITFLEAKADQSNTIAINTIVKNTGNHHYKAKNEISIYSPSGRSISTVNSRVTSVSIIPTFAYRFSVEISQEDFNNPLEPGIYKAVSKFYQEDGTLVDTAETSFEIVKSSAMPIIPGVNWQFAGIIMGIFLIVGIILSIIVYRRSRAYN